MPAIDDIADGDELLASWGQSVADALNGPTTSYAVSLSAASVNPTLGSGSSAVGAYKDMGNGLLYVEFEITFGSSGVAAGTGTYGVTLPTTTTKPATSGIILSTLRFYDDSANQVSFGVAVWSTSTSFTMRVVNGPNSASAIVANNVPQTWAANDILAGSLLVMQA